MTIDIPSTVVDPVLCSVLDAAALARQQCLEILDLLDAYAEESGGNNAAKEKDLKLQVSRHQKQLHARLAQIRGLNHEAMMGTRATKSVTADAKGDIDRLHLELQNLYYEESHLRGEIQACEEYEHPYQQLPLIDVATFLQSHPESSDDDEDTLMVARIHHEHEVRKDLEARRQKLVKQKQNLIAENSKRRLDLANLDKDLEKFIEAAQPIQKILDKEYQS